jgi:ribonuclease BN (tRNA processing enzyme)
VTAAVPHGSTWTTAFRITADKKSVAFLSDVEYPAPDQPTPAAVSLATGVDLLIHDAMHADHEYDMRRGWGHSPAQAGVLLAQSAGVGKLALTHHSPDATDAMIDAVVARARTQIQIPVIGAAEGSYLEI